MLRASTYCALVVAALASLLYWCTGSWLVGLFTSVEAVRTAARHYLPWIVALPVVSVWGFQLDGIFIGATRGRELRDSMLISFVIFFGLAVGLERPLGNHGLWCAFSIWMAVRGVTLAMRSRIERGHDPAPVTR